MKVIIVGGGQVGAYIAHTLLNNNIDVKIIENRPGIFEKLVNDFPDDVVVVGDGTSHEKLIEAGIVDCDVLVAVAGADETNLVVSTLAKLEYGVPKTIARVNNPKNEWLFNHQMGVDVHLNQADLMSRMIIENIDLSNIETMMKLSKGDYSIIKIKVMPISKAKNTAIKDLQLPNRSLLIAINRIDQVILPKGDIRIAEDDEIIALVHDQEKDAITNLFQN
jgi:trk system potassium uptake protein TrkA